MEKCLLKKPTRISFKAVGDNSNGASLSHRRRSNVGGQDDIVVAVEDLKLGEQFSMVLSNKG